MKITKEIIFYLLLASLFISNNLYFREFMTEKVGDTDNVEGAIVESDIPEGSEDLYVLKSAIVPPVCPKCPDINVCPKNDLSKCPPCPPCGRCPEPAFKCKKVPNYESKNTGYLPQPILTDFSQFSA